MLTLLTLVVFKELHAFEGSGTSDELMGEFGLVVGLAVPAILIVYLSVILLSVVYQGTVSNGLAMARAMWRSAVR